MVEPVYDLLGYGGDLRRVGDVDLERKREPPQPLDLARHREVLHSVVRDHGDVGALPREGRLTALPIPRPAPVTTATLFSSFIYGLPSRRPVDPLVEFNSPVRSPRSFFGSHFPL